MERRHRDRKGDIGMGRRHRDGRDVDRNWRETDRKERR